MRTLAESKKIAQAAGYDIREGSYTGTSDDVLGTWYVTHKDDDLFRPFGRGAETQREAWNQAAELAVQQANVFAPGGQQLGNHLISDLRRNQ